MDNEEVGSLEKRLVKVPNEGTKDVQGRLYSGKLSEGEKMRDRGTKAK